MSISKSNLRPTKNRVLCQRIKEPDTGGITIPEAFRRNQDRAIVVSVGPGRRTKKGVLVPVCFCAGDTIIIEPHRGQDIIENGVPMTLLEEQDVIAVIPKEPNA